MAPRNGDVVEEDVTLGMAPGPGHVLTQQVAGAHVRAPRDDQDARAVRDLDQGEGGILVGDLPAVVGRMEGDRGVVAVREQRVPTRRAEVDALGVAMPAVVTEHGNHGTPRHGSVPRPAARANIALNLR